tara:strand:+ start:443 stop:1162 length:720 start_codon:yes stop_codon:yes gene_type:complete
MHIKTYWDNTKSPLYSFLFTLPLFLLYELGIFLSTSNEMISMRNGADALLRQLLSAFGMNGFYWIGVVFLLGFIIVFWLQKKFWEHMEIKGKHLLLMMFESIIWALILYFFMSNVNILLMNPSGRIIIQKVTLAIGAGIYEEFVFRVLLILGISGILGFVFQWENKYKKNLIAMIIAAAIFSLFHFIGEFGDYFSFNLFMIRFFAGIVLGFLYFFRGFGITSWAHSIYDLIILTRITTD